VAVFYLFLGVKSRQQALEEKLVIEVGLDDEDFPKPIIYQRGSGRVSIKCRNLSHGKQGSLQVLDKVNLNIYEVSRQQEPTTLVLFIPTYTWA